MIQLHIPFNSKCFVCTVLSIVNHCKTGIDKAYVASIIENHRPSKVVAHYIVCALLRGNIQEYTSTLFLTWQEHLSDLYYTRI